MPPVLRACSGFSVALGNALFPKRCIACDRLIRSQASPGLAEATRFQKSQDAPGAFGDVLSPYVCASCIGDIKTVSPPYCEKCGLMFMSRKGENHVCENCMKAEHFFSAARSCGVYEGPLMEAVHKFKYLHKTRMAEPFSLIMFQMLTRVYDIAGIDIVAPVPLHIKKMRRRGFNQAYLLIQPWPLFAQIYGIDISHIQIAREILVKTRETPSQVGMTRAQRAKNIKGVFSAANEDRIRGRSILLVDDVLTTGATMNECARTLINKGASRVLAMTLARTDAIRRNRPRDAVFGN